MTFGRNSLWTLPNRTRRLRIVYTATHCWPEVRRGGERLLHELAAGMSRAGHDVTIVSTAPAANNGEVLGVPVRRLRRRRAWPRRLGEHAAPMAFGAQTFLHLLANRWDVWHALTVPDGAAAAGAAVGTRRSVYTELGFPSARSHERRPDRRLHQYIVDHADTYTTLSTAAGDVLQRDYGRAAVRAGGGVDIGRFAPGRERHSRPAILFASDVNEPRKNAALLLEAVAILLDRLVDVEVWFTGPGDPRVLLSTAPRRVRDAVTIASLVGQDDLVTLYGRAWVAALPSVAEALGLVVLEANACGTPTVVMRGSGGPEELVDKGTGVVADPTAESLADALEGAIELANQADTVAACRAVATRWDWDTVIVPLFESIYERG